VSISVVRRTWMGWVVREVGHAMMLIVLRRKGGEGGYVERCMLGLC